MFLHRLNQYLLPTDIEGEIETLQGLSERSAKDNSRLSELRSELEKVNKKKEEWVAEHPEHRKLVFKARRKQNDDKEEEVKKPELKSRNLFNKKGLPRHPERSIYYDPVMNPFGVPPPGMPYMERRKYLVFPFSRTINSSYCSIAAR